MNIALTDDWAVIIAALQFNHGRILINIDADGMIRDNFINDASSENHLFANNSWLWLANIIGNEESPSSNPLPFYFILFSTPDSTWTIWIILLIIIILGTAFLYVLFIPKKRKKDKNRDF